MQSHQHALRGHDLKPFLQRSDAQAALMLLANYGLIVLAFAMAMMFHHPVIYLLSVLLLGNRQLGLGILMHDCVHRALFKKPKVNDWVGNYLCASPILAQFEGYRRYHLRHHAKAGTTEDPDYLNYCPYPVEKASVLRKLLRDIIGITGLKNLALLMMMHAGVIEYDMAYKQTDKQRLSVAAISRNLFVNLWPAVVFHALLIALLVSLGEGALYSLWWIAYMTTFQLFSRIRNAAEHANVPDLLDVDPRKHARTVQAGLLARLSVAPNHVNYHLEHHWLPSAPPYRLAAFHAYLQSHQLLGDAQVLPNYASVMRQLYKA